MNGWGVPAVHLYAALRDAYAVWLCPGCPQGSASGFHNADSRRLALSSRRRCCRQERSKSTLTRAWLSGMLPDPPHEAPPQRQRHRPAGPKHSWHGRQLGSRRGKRGCRVPGSSCLQGHGARRVGMEVWDSEAGAHHAALHSSTPPSVPAHPCPPRATTTRAHPSGKCPAAGGGLPPAAGQPSSWTRSSLRKRRKKDAGRHLEHHRHTHSAPGRPLRARHQPSPAGAARRGAPHGCPGPLDLRWHKQGPCRRRLRLPG